METSASIIAGSALRRHAILCVLGASACYSVSGALVKAVSAEFPTAEIVLFRSAIAVLVTLPLLWRHGGLIALRTRRPWGHLARTITGFVGMVTSYYGYSKLPLAINTVLGFTMPLLLTLLAVPLLGERAGWRRMCAVLVGLAGVVVVVRPWHHGADSLPLVPVVVVLLGVVAWALSMISIRRMGGVGESNVAIVLWFSFGATAMGAAMAVPVWQTPDPLQLAALTAVGMISGIAQLLMTEGYRRGEPSLVAPFEYGAILYTTVLGMAIWSEIPDLWNIVGIVIIIGSGLYIWQYEAGPGRK